MADTFSSSRVTQLVWSGWCEYVGVKRRERGARRQAEQWRSARLIRCVQNAVVGVAVCEGCTVSLCCQVGVAEVERSYGWCEEETVHGDSCSPSLGSQTHRAGTVVVLMCRVGCLIPDLCL